MADSVSLQSEGEGSGCSTDLVMSPNIIQQRRTQRREGQRLWEVPRRRPVQRHVRLQARSERKERRGKGGGASAGCSSRSELELEQPTVNTGCCSQHGRPFFDSKIQLLSVKMGRMFISSVKTSKIRKEEISTKIQSKKTSAMKDIKRKHAATF